MAARSRRGAPAVAAALLLGVPAVAWADEQMSASLGNRYDQTRVTIDQGERLTFANHDVRRHDVSANDAGDFNGRLFASDLIDNGQTAPVRGVQHLTAGEYGFMCSVHPEMTGTLVVTSAGTPVPRDGGGGGGGGSADTQAPEVSLSAKRPRASKLRAKRRLVFRLTSSEAGGGDVTAGNVKLGGDIEAGTVKLTAKFSKGYAKRFKKGYRLKLEARVSDGAGNVGTDKLTLKLR